MPPAVHADIAGSSAAALGTVTVGTATLGSPGPRTVGHGSSTLVRIATALLSAAQLLQLDQQQREKKLY